jgi:ligand-binding SRPBCC domain-containing protein
MSCVIVNVAARVQAPPMTWEEDTRVERLRQLLRSWSITQQDNEARRKRSSRIRDFLTVFGSQHWAERIEARRLPPQRGEILF